MKVLEYQAVVIGGGSGGYAAVSKLSGYGVKAAVVEMAEEMGGLCILRGCMPSKGLIESGNLMRKMRRSADFGIHCSDLKADMEAIQDRKQRLISEFQESRVEQLENGDFDLIRGKASFTSANEILVEKENESIKLTAQYIVIATGSKPRIPDILGLKDGDFWLSKDILNTRTLPEHLVVIGGGAIGCEMAHCFEGLGSKVTILQRSGCILNDFDKEISDCISEASRERGIDVRCNTDTKEVKWDGSGKPTLTVVSEGKEDSIAASHLLVSTGRVPATDSLCVDEAGIETEKARILVDAEMRTNRSHIFAIGDTTSKLPIVHEAVLQGEAVAARIAFELGREKEDILKVLHPEEILFGVFSHPECAMVGLSSEEIEKRGIETISVSFPFEDQGKSQLIGETEGFIKIVADKETRKLVAASAIGPHVIDLIHEMQVAIHCDLTIEEFAAIPHYHPTLAEIWTYAIEEFEA